MEPVILYVEDDMLSREVMKVMLTRVMGYKTENLYFFENSASFDTRLIALPAQPTLIFLDIHMEPIDGFEVLNLLRQHEPYQATKVIALTASVMNEEVKRLKEAGFAGVIAKPLNSDTFPDTLQRILRDEPVWSVR
jgi:CheY-like chemotaxis protein